MGQLPSNNLVLEPIVIINLKMLLKFKQYVNQVNYLLPLFIKIL